MVPKIPPEVNHDVACSHPQCGGMFIPARGWLVGECPTAVVQEANLLAKHTANRIALLPFRDQILGRALLYWHIAFSPPCLNVTKARPVASKYWVWMAKDCCRICLKVLDVRLHAPDSWRQPQTGLGNDSPIQQSILRTFRRNVHSFRPP